MELKFTSIYLILFMKKLPSLIGLIIFRRLLSENAITSVNRAMFRGLNNLASLSLYGNLISCVTPGAFDELTGMTSLNLISNPASLPSARVEKFNSKKCANMEI